MWATMPAPAGADVAAKVKSGAVQTLGGHAVRAPSDATSRNGSGIDRSNLRLETRQAEATGREGSGAEVGRGRQAQGQGGRGREVGAGR